MIDNEIMKEYILEYNNALREAAVSFDVNKFIEFAREYNTPFYRLYEKGNVEDAVIEIMIRKIVVNLKDPPRDKYEEAKEWLLSRGYDLKVW